MKPKHMDNVDMSFVAGEEVKTETQKPKATETFERDGTKIYEEREDGMTVFFDKDGKELPASTVENLAIGYPPIPDITDNGAEKKGDLQTRYVKQENIPGGVKSTDCEEGDCDMVILRQDYEDGNAVIQTIPKKLHNVVKFLRGEYSGKEEE
ncbi:hypothetical protein [Serratia sp. (in: enterobacteria)]|uniref:hypothetical protein n=1 Tax=Serratia sp. (in: enterobacteria) TaxID=616 RepID=UPI00398A270A